MDLVKIGFQINANGLKDANTEVDKLLDKVDNIGTKGKKASSDFESSQKKVQDSVKKTEKVSTNASDKMIQKQQTLNQLLPYMDKNTANLASSFWLVSKEAQSFNKYLDLLESNKAITEQKKQVEGLAKEQAKASASEEVARQKRLLADQNYYQKLQEQARKATNKELESLQKAEASAESLRQKKLLSEQNYYLRVQEEAKKASAKEQESLKKIEVEQEALRQKRLLSEQNYYLKTQEEAKKAADKEKALQQKAVDDAEKARQQSLSRIQNDYIKQQETIAKAQQSAIDKQVKAQNTLNESNQKAITLEQAKAKYVSQGYGKTDSTRLARLEVSGADVTTLNNYKSAIEATTRATQALNPAVEKATTSHSNFLDQVKGIAIYAALSAAIYGVMTAITSLAVATVKMADEYTSIQNRMKLYINDSQTLATVNRNLGKMAMENNVGLRETATLYTRLAPALQKLGGNAATVTAVVDAFGKSMRIGGATAQEAASATIQFSQAMASGKLAGDEFRSISEASPRFLKAIADGSGIATESLKKLSSEGFLTTSLVARALLKEYPTLIEENKKLGVTMEQGANAIKTGFLVAIGEFNEGAGLTKALGEAMLDLAQGMFTAAQGARQFGADVKKWFKDNADTIQTVVDAFQLLATVIASKYVASMIVAGAISLKTAYNMNIAALGATALQRAFGVATIASLRLGSALASLATPKNLFTLGLTVAGVATAYLLLRDNAAEAISKIAEQSEYIDLTTEAYKKLNSEQQKNAQSSLTEDVNKINDELDSQANAVNRVLLSYAQFKQMQGKALNKETSDVINQTVRGLISYDTAYRKLIALGVPKNVVEDFKKQKDVYDEAAKAGLKTEAAARAAGLGIKLSGNEAQNATPAVQGLKDGVDGLAAASLNTADSFAKMVEGFKTGVADIKTTLKVMQSYDLEKGIAQQLIKESQNIAKQHPAIVKANRAIQKGKEKDIAALGAKPSQKQLNAITKHYDAIGKSVLKSQESLTEAYIKQGSSAAQELQLWSDKESKFISDQSKKDKPPKKQEADAQRAANANQKIVDKYDNQEAIAIRLNEYLKAGVGYSVAKVASEGKYVKVYGHNLETARKIAKARQEVADIEESSKGREDSQNALRKQFRDQQAIGDFMKEGYSYAVAQATVQSGFAVNADGIANANNRTLISLRDQLTISEAESSYQQDLLDHVKSGLSVEEASAKVAIYRNKHLNQGLIITAEELAKAKQREQVDKSRLALELESNSYKEQATYLVQTTNNELADIMAKHKGVSLQEAQTLQTRKDIVDKLTEYNDLLEKQRTLAYDIENVNFDVFGDFGNPFKSALEGLNSLLFGMSDLEAKYQRMGADLTARIDKEKKGSEAQNLLIAQKADLELAHIQESKQARDKAITSGLSLTKSLFKEESKGYKVVSGLEKAYQASKIAFALWEKKDTIKTMAIKLAGYAKDAITFVTGAATKIAAQMGLNVAQAQGAVASAANAPPPVGFASAAAMIALMAGIGIAISGGGSGEYVDTSNQGTGTVFGDSEAKSASIANSIDLLSENSDLMLPLTSAMLRSLKNIESNIGGVTNLILRSELGKGFNVSEGFQQDKLGSLVGNVGSLALGGAGAIGGGIAGAFGAGLLGAGMGSALGIGLGLATGGIGLLLGATLGKALGGLFGTKTTVNASGLFGEDQKLGDILSEGFNLQEYIDIQTKKKALGITTSNKSSTKYSKADAELSNQFTLIFGGFYNSILSATDILGADMSAVQTNLENAVVSIGKINLKGLSGDEIQEKLEAVFGAAADSLAKQAFGSLEDLQTVGEGYFETLVRVASAVEEAAYYTDRLNVTAIDYTKIVNKQAEDLATEIIRQSYLTKVGISTIKGGMTDLVNTFDGSAEEITDFINTLEDLQDQLFMTGKSGDYLTSSMILGAGGLDSLSSGFDAYFEMLSPAEQAAELTRRLTKEFALFGEQLPANAIAYRDLLNSITDTELATEAGQKLYGQIIALAPEFNDLQDSLDKANSEVNALVQSLRDLAEQARAARGETEQPRNLAYTRNQFEQASVLAMQGDIASAEKLLTLGKDLMGLSKTYSVTGSEYARDLALIQRAATVSADIQEQGLGTSISTTLTPSAGSTTTPTVNTTNSTMTTELQGMREDLNAGLFAIAKFVQNVDSRTERWDDGNRVMVGIQPENGDTPVPVVVTP